MANSQSLHQHWHFPDPEYRQYCDQLADQITELSGHLNAGNYQLLKLIGEFDEKKGWSGEGILSCA